MITREDITQAVEIAMGDSLSSDSFKATTVSAGSIRTWPQRFKRILAELPPDLSVHELLEAMDED